MSNALVKDGKPWNCPLFGNGGAIKTINVISPMPKTVEEMIKNFQDVPISRIRSYANRDTDVKAIKKILKARGGIDGRIAKAPSGAIIKGDPNKIVWVYDGDHTRHIWMGVHSSEKTMPMHVIEVDSMEEVSELFINNNKTGKTKITTEQEFVNLYHAGNSKALKRANFAKNVGLFVYCSHEPEGKVGDVSGFKVKVNTLAKLLEACTTAQGTQNLQSVRQAVRLVSEMSEFQENKPVELNITLALTMLYECYPSLLGKQKNKFEAWFKQWTQGQALREVVSIAQIQCGQAARGSQHTYYVASGILKILKSRKIPGMMSFRPSTLEKRFSPNY